MQTFLVGGAVRDMLMGTTPKDRDFVVVGATIQDMLDKGFSQVGKDFPVFLDTEGNEYALARKERKTGDKHTDFTFSIDNVSLQDDLRRRDLTINSIAFDEQACDFIDPFNGQTDIKNKILRHVDEAGFREDPLRVLRIARFLARWPSFSVAPETMKLCQEMAQEGMLKHLTAERVLQEMRKTFRSNGQPSRFFYFLRMVDALVDTFPEVANLIDVEQPYKHHPEGDVFIHTMMVLDQTKMIYTSGVDELEIVRFCALTHDLGKASTDPVIWPHHYGHEQAGVPIIESMAERLRLPNELRDHAKLVARFHTHIHNFQKLKPSTIVNMFESLKVRQNKYIMDVLPAVSACDSRGRTSFNAMLPYPNEDRAQYVFHQLSNIRARDICSEEELKNVNTIKRNLEKAAVGVVTNVRANISEPS